MGIRNTCTAVATRYGIALPLTTVAPGIGMLWTGSLAWRRLALRKKVWRSINCCKLTLSGAC